MAWTAPTAAELKIRFPGFAAVDDAVVQAALDEAAFYVDETWISESQFKTGRMLYAAHVLTLDKQGAGLESRLAGLSGFSSVTLGPMQISGGGKSGSEAFGSLSSTSYGVRFLALLRMNSPGVAVV